MQTDYNEIANEYQRAKQQPWRYYVERYTYFSLLGDIQGQSVLDLACGEGYYTRALKHKGASRIVGVDLAQGMIDLARKEEERLPLGIEYRVGDARNLESSDPFDLVVASYLLNYASTVEDLLAMCRAIARNLKPGGRFVTVNNNPEQCWERFETTRPYGFIKSSPAPLKEGDPITYTIFLEEGSFLLTNYYLSKETHEEAFAETGFFDLRWHSPQVSPEGIDTFGEDFWRPFLDDPPILFLEAHR